MDTDIEMKEPKRDNPLSFHYSASLKKITLPVNKQNNLNVTWMMLCCISLLSCDAHQREAINQYHNRVLTPWEELCVLALGWPILHLVFLNISGWNKETYSWCNIPSDTIKLLCILPQKEACFPHYLDPDIAISLHSTAGTTFWRLRASQGLFEVLYAMCSLNFP